MPVAKQPRTAGKRFFFTLPDEYKSIPGTPAVKLSYVGKQLVPIFNMPLLTNLGSCGHLES